MVAFKTKTDGSCATLKLLRASVHALSSIDMPYFIKPLPQARGSSINNSAKKL
jgi:hypothetical protein